MFSCTEEGIFVGVGDFIFYILTNFTIRFTLFLISLHFSLIFYIFYLCIYMLLPWLDLIKHVHVLINLFYYEHWADKWKHIPYISLTHKVLKYCRSKMVTLANDVCESPSPDQNLLIPPPSYPPNFYSLPTKSQFNAIKK